MKTLTTICTVIISLNIFAQPRNHNGGQPQQNNNQNDNRALASNSRGGNRGHVSIHIGGYPTYYGNNYGYGYNNYGYNNYYYSVKKAARNSIRQSANVIGQALQFSDWNDTYSPWLAKAIRHQQYAKQLYFWGDYAGALNHAERAGFLAWNTLSYFNNPYGYNNSYPDPYSDPNNPYYRQSNPGSSQPGSNSDDDYSYRKGTAENNGSTKREAQPVTEQNINKAELDNSLPQSKMSDRELLKTNLKDLDIE